MPTRILFLLRMVATIAGIASCLVLESARAQTIISADIPYAEQYTVWHLVNAPLIGPAVTLTTIDQITF